MPKTRIGSPFDECVRKIERAYADLGHTSGWRFLYTPAKTLSPKTKVVFLGLNPGGESFEEPQPSTEEGNAYRCEEWDGNRLNALQRQVCAFYSLLAAAIPGETRDSLMDASLAANFCPFRSKSYTDLKNAGSLEFSRHLWSEILPTLEPAVIITMGCVVEREVSALLVGKGKLTKAKDYPSGWGSLKCRAAIATLNGREVLLVNLPHLSRFRIFDRSSGNNRFRAIIARIAELL